MECFTICEEHVIAKRMYSKSWNSIFFLYENQPLSKVISDDMELLSCFGIGTEQIADKLETLIYGAEDKNYNVSSFPVPSLPLCPFSAEFSYQYEKILSFKITNTLTNESIEIENLQIHMIRKHAFFGGPGTPMRLEPRKLIGILDLESGVDYSSKILRKWKWKSIESRETVSEEEFLRIKAYFSFALISGVYEGIDWMVTLNSLPLAVPTNDIRKYSNWMELFINDKMKSLKDVKEEAYESSIRRIEDEIAIKVKILDKYREKGVVEGLFLLVYNSFKKHTWIMPLGIRVEVKDAFHLFMLMRETHFKV